MPDRRTTSVLQWIRPVIAAAVLLPGLLAMHLSRSGTSSHQLPTLTALIVSAASVMLCRRWPISATLAISLGYVFAVQTGSLPPTASNSVVNASSAGIGLAVVVICFTLASLRPRFLSLVALVVVTGASQWHDINPFPVMVTVGAWLLGTVIQARQELVQALKARGEELDGERERYAVEAVRYERGRIARELHDIIAHSMSVVVIQASAARRLGTSAVADGDDVLTVIGELARQAEADIIGVSRLLSSDADAVHQLSREVVDNLVAHAAATGTAIEVSVAGDLDTIPHAASAALHRVLQEGLTNAVKHAPGAPINITMRCADSSVRMVISNDPAPAAALLAGHSGHNGLRGLTERVTAAAGTLIAGPTAVGGWQITTVLPLR